MKFLIPILLSACFASAATTYPMLSDTANARLVGGGSTNIATLTGTNTFAGTNTFSGVVNIGNSNAATWATNKLGYYSVLLTNSISDTSFTNSTTETTVVTYTLPANLMGAYGKAVLSGLLLRNPVGGGNITWRIRINGTQVNIAGPGAPNATSPALYTPTLVGVPFLYGTGSTSSYLAVQDTSGNATYPAFAYDDTASTNVLTITAQNATVSSINLCAATNVWLYVYKP